MMVSMTTSSFASLFLQPELLNLNAGTISSVPLPVIERLEREQRAFEANPAPYWFKVWPELWKVQRRLGEFLHADPTALFLRHNVTYACNDFIMGVELAPGELVTTNLEYGAITNILRLRAQHEGRTVRSLELPVRPQSSQELVQAVLAGLRPESRLLLISHVTTGTGMVMPLQEIARETRRRGVVLVVDGAHAPGAIPLDFRELQDVDFYGANLHKWMMGPKGTGFGWVPEWRQPSVRNTQGGWTTFEVGVPFDQFGEGHRFAQRMMLASSLNFPSFLALSTLLDFWQTHGAPAIRHRQRELRDHLRSEVREKLQLKLAAPSDPTLHSVLSAYELPEQLQGDPRLGILNLLQEIGVAVNFPYVGQERFLRFSVGIWNDEAQVSEGIERLAKYMNEL